MTELTTAPMPGDYKQHYEVRRDNFYSQTIAENNARLNAKTMPADVRDELKFIESVLLTLGEGRELGEGAGLE